MSLTIKKSDSKRSHQTQVDDNTKNAVLQVLKKFKGWKPLSRQELAMFAHTTDRNMRLAIEELREEGHPICAEKDGSGYWLGTRKEYEATAIADYKARIISCAKKVNAFYGEPLEGQVTIDVLR